VPTKFTSRFIKVHIVTNNPGNPIVEYYQQVDHIWGFGEASAQHAAIGAAATIHLAGDSRMYVKESVDDIYNALSQIDLLP
jgi:hypothetical protein